MIRKIIYFISFLSAILFLRILLFEIYAINQNSMKNTYEPGSRVLIIKNLYSIKRNDVLVFTYENQNVIKRCVGLPGDTLKIISGTIYLNNVELPSPTTAIFKTNNAIDVFTRSSMNYTYGTNWTPYDMGPYLIPYKGMKLVLSPKAISLYGSVIKNDSSYNRNLRNNATNDSLSYVFQHNYYFLVGDNRIGSIDSRSFGPIMESTIKGKAIINF